jgi:CBS domain-containing protein
MGILNRARVPAVTIEPTASVIQGIALMKREGVETLFVVDEGELVGALTERDVAIRVVLRRRDPKATPIQDAMTSPAVALSRDVTVGQAAQTMLERGVSHAAVVGREGIEGMVSLREILQERVAELTDHLDSLVAPLLADGIGG